jgi:hypothetical protein
VNSDNVGWVLAITFAAVAVSAAVWLARPALRRNRYLVAVLASSVTALFLEIGFIALFLMTLANMPDMRDF